MPGNAPGRRNLMVCSLTVGDGPWQHLAPNQAVLSQASLWPSISWDVTSQFRSVRLSGAGRGSAGPAGPAARAATAFPCTEKGQHHAGCAALELQLLHISVSLPVSGTALGQQNQLHGTCSPQVSSPLTMDTVSISSRDNAP